MSEYLDFQADGPTPEMPLEAAQEGYATTPPSFGEAILGEARGGAGAFIARAIQRGGHADASIVDRGLNYITGGATPIEEPLLPADEANERFAPEGTKIATAPMPEGLARVIGRQKQDELDREATWTRFSNAHSWPANFAAGTAAFMLDPLNVGSLFIPGIGEENILAGAARAGMGSGIAARLIARAGSQATAGAAAQVPLSAIKYGLGTEEASDYAMRAALKDVLFGAAGGAMVGGGIGALREAGVLKPDAIMVPQTNHAAMRAATAQIVSGQPVDVEPVLAAHGEPVTDIGAIAARQAEVERNGYAPGMSQPEFDRLKEDIYNPAPPAGGARAQEAAAIERGGYTLTPEEAAHFDRYANTPAKVRAAYARMDLAEHINTVQSGLKELGVTDADPAFVARAAELMRGGHEVEASASYERAVMESVREKEYLDSIGAEEILRGTPFEHFIKQEPAPNESFPEIPFERRQAGGAGAEVPPIGTGEPRPGPGIRAAGEGAPRHGGQSDAEAVLEARLMADPHLTAEDHALISAANDDMRAAADRAGAYAQAAGCLSGAGP